MYGWSGRILRIDLTNHTWAVDKTDSYTQRFIGGKGINVKIAYDEIPAGCKYDDPENLLILGPGVLTGTPAPTASRMKVTALAPNNTLMSCGIGGYIGAEIRHAGYDNIVISGVSDSPIYLNIDDQGAQFINAGQIWGQDCQQTETTIRDELDDQETQVVTIGPAGEKGVSFSCIMTGVGHSAGHGGLGAVMGRKNLKALAVRGKQGIDIAHLDAFMELSIKSRHEHAQDPQIQSTIQNTGKSVIYESIKGGLAVFGNFENADWTSLDPEDYKKSGEEFWEKYGIGRAGCFGCSVADWQLFNVPGIGVGKPKCAGLVAGGTPLWNMDRKAIFEFGHLCNLYGLGVSSTANVIAFLMELRSKGILKKDDLDGLELKPGRPEDIIATVHKIGKQEGFGHLVKDGVLAAAKLIDHGAEEMAMHVKGLEMQMYEYRPLKAMALAQAVASKDHIDANPMKEVAELLTAMMKGTPISPSYEDRGHHVLEAWELKTISDIAGVCQFFNHRGQNTETISTLIELATGENIGTELLYASAKRILNLERAFNTMRGFGRKDDILPERLFQTPISGGIFKGQQLEHPGFNKMLDDYYSVCGWNNDGIPTEETFRNLGMDSEWNRFEQHMKERSDGQTITG